MLSPVKASTNLAGGRHVRARAQDDSPFPPEADILRIKEKASIIGASRGFSGQWQRASSGAHQEECPVADVASLPPFDLGCSEDLAGSIPGWTSPGPAELLDPAKDPPRARGAPAGW